ncbi:MAG TPA: AsnC family transcriptional regulator [Azospirillaceae bacterium]|nr:AsnC family transcriptional regulator [Azospirillaceae bacterium]HRQ82584.1 AsnC family transcriptional regulator [Azospirillaceae bacterium]
MEDLDAIDRALLNDFQRDFPLTPRPYAEIARRLEIGEDEALTRYMRLLKEGYIARIGAAVRPNTVGAGTLAALAVPPDRLEEVAATVSAMPGVNHNYARDHQLNLWFVVTEPDREKVAETLAAVAQATGLTPLSFPLVTGYHIDLGFPLWEQ